MNGMTRFTVKKRAQNILLLFLEDINKIQNCKVKMRVFNLNVQAIQNKLQLFNENNKIRFTIVKSLFQK